MLIILEGVDGSGKTTLATTIQNLVGGRLLHRGPLKGDPLEEYLDELDDYAPGCGFDVICDRWHLGELVYGPLLREESKLTPAGRWYIEGVLRSKGTLLVHCAPGAERARRSVDERGDELIRAEDVLPILNAYARLVPQTNCAFMEIDPFASSTYDVAMAAIERAALIERAAADTAGFSTLVYGGIRDVDLLLLGERRNGEKDPTALMPSATGCGRYLLEALRPWDKQLGIVSLANALEEDVPALVSALRPKHVVTLGNKSYFNVIKQGIAPPFGSVPHPQYVRRFLHGHDNWYRDLIVRAATTGEDLRKCRP